MASKIIFNFLIFLTLFFVSISVVSANVCLGIQQNDTATITVINTFEVEGYKPGVYDYGVSEGSSHTYPKILYWRGYEIFSYYALNIKNYDRIMYFKVTCLTPTGTQIKKSYYNTIYYNIWYNNTSAGINVIVGTATLIRQADDFYFYFSWYPDKISLIPYNYPLTFERVGQVIYDYPHCSLDTSVMYSYPGAKIYDCIYSNSEFNGFLYFGNSTQTQLCGDYNIIKVVARYNYTYAYCCEPSIGYILQINATRGLYYGIYNLNGELIYNTSTAEYNFYYTNLSPFIFSHGITLGNLEFNKKNLNDKVKCDVGIKKAYLNVYSKNGEIVDKYYVKINDTEEYTVDNYDFDLTPWYNKSINITISPYFDKRLSENFNITVKEGKNKVTLNQYFYAVTIKAYYKPPLGDLKPIAFKVVIDGEMKPDKQNSKGNYYFTGGAFETITLKLPAGVYNFTLTGEVIGIAGLSFTRTETTIVELMDNLYYRNLLFTITLTDSEINQTANETAILQVYVQDQNGNAVNNADVKLSTNVNTEIATIKTVNGNAVFTGLIVGETYKVEVYINNIKKSEKTITLTSVAQTLIITITLSEQERQNLQQQQSGQIEKQNVVNVFSGLINSLVFWAFIIVCVLAVLSAQYAGERIALIVFVAGIGMLTYVVPMLPQAIFITIVVVAGILFSWKVVNKFTGGEEP